MVIFTKEQYIYSLVFRGLEYEGTVPTSRNLQRRFSLSLVSNP